MISPSETSSLIRLIASKVSSSGADLKKIRRSVESLADRLSGVSVPERIASEMFKTALEELEVSFWDSDEGTAVDDAYKAARKQEEADALEASLKLLRRKVDRFISEIQSPSQEEFDDSDVVTSAPPIR